MEDLLGLLGISFFILLGLAGIISSRSGYSRSNPFTGEDWIWLGSVILGGLVLTVYAARMTNSLWWFIGAVLALEFFAWIMYDMHRHR